MSPLTLPDLPYDYNELEPHISAEIMELHHDTHHAGYVKKAGAAMEKLADARDAGDFSTVTMLEKDLAFNLSGHRLHSVFWTNLSPDGGGEPAGELLHAIDSSFGGFDRLRQHLTESTTTIKGSGWGALAWDDLSRRLVVEQIYDHQSNVVQGAEPLLVFDAWEHAFYLQYHNDKASYVDGLWHLVNWDDVSQRFEEATAGLTVAASG